MNKYQRNKEKARDLAIQWQWEFADRDLSYSELFGVATKFEKLGKRYGLLKEFRENGII